ncbi:hypothetical protein HQN60_05035 [Deefgea piscis]|uniref:Glycosyltransferase n=1 Tax=Deefgea piscis TaxID=2739061 RepID=A0A6M8SPN9_9NEIS|nr:hypothetical protein [Deefgea piscis]QKJ66128.1 hypothetical protein HQN60_05035 [Deefgea piscis]
MLDFNVVHLARTPLVGAPGKVSKAINLAGGKSTSFCLSDYPDKGGLFGKFIDNTIVINNASSSVIDYFNGKLKSADIIHVHNEIDNSLCELIQKFAPTAKCIYQVHSPKREGPLYLDRSEFQGVDFVEKLTVAQYQPRQYPDYTLVPNLVMDMPSINLRKDTEPLRIMFTPSHNRGGRWNSKCSEKLDVALNALKACNLIDLVQLEQPLHPSSLLDLRRTCHASIDEIVTGAYHQVSLEGLCAGNVVINAADHVSKSMLSAVSNASVLPPFYYVDENNALDALLELAKSPSLTREYQTASNQFFVEYLTATKLVKRFFEVYENALKN